MLTQPQRDMRQLRRYNQELRLFDEALTSAAQARDSLGAELARLREAHKALRKKLEEDGLIVPEATE